ncbi:MAG: TPM domain-containing protein [Selenomonadaceae bacterium]|nr:TPM domain-containing protein [Selenomonadaceae bacterium]
MKRIIILMILTLMITSSIALASVTDEASLLNGSEISKLNSKIQQIEHKHGIKIEIVTLNELQGSNIKNVANKMLNRVVDSPRRGENGNIIFVMAMDVRKWQIAADQSLESKLYDSNNNAAFNEKAFVNQFSQGKFFNGFDMYLDSIDKAIDSYKATGQVKGNENYNVNETEDKTFDLLAAMISIVAAIVIAIMYRSSLIASMSNVRPAIEASEYLDKNSVKLMTVRDNFLYMNVQRRPKSQGKGSSGGGGGSSSGGGHGGGF